MKKTLIAVSLALASFAASAAEYYVVVPFAGKAQSVASKISVVLNAATLPDGKINKAYAGFDLNAALQVTGDAAFNSSGVTWSITSGSLPTGLSLGSDGNIGGTPTAVVSNQSFEAQAAYKGSLAKRIFALTVNPLSSCTTSWGDTIASDTTYGSPVYSSSTVDYPASCSDVVTTLSCSDGTLSAPTASKTCSVVDADWQSVVAFLKFDGSWVDAKGYTVTPSGSATLSADSKFGSGSASFGPATGMLTMPRGPFLFGTADFTVEMFIKPNNTTSNGQLAGMHKNAVTNDWLLYYKGGKLEFLWGPPSFTSTNAAMAPGVWHHVAVTRNTDKLNLWLDGVNVGSTTIIGPIPNATSWPMTIGSDVGGSLQFQGGIDSFRVTAGKARYSSNFTVPASEFPSR